MTIIKVRRKYKTYYSTKKKERLDPSFKNKYLLSMIHNLSLMNSFKLYQDTDSLYITILNELSEIKSDISKKININNSLIKYSNHICSDNIDYIFKLLLGSSWKFNFSKKELEIIDFIREFIRPVSFWDSEHHKTEVGFANQFDFNENNKSKMTKEIIESLMSLVPRPDDRTLGRSGSSPMLNLIPNDKSENKISSIIVNSPEPSFLKTINELIELSPRKIIRRFNHYSKIECVNVLSDDTIKITKNLKSTTLIEDKIGVNIFIRINERIIVIQGLMKEDLLNTSLEYSYIKKRSNKHTESVTFDLITIPKYFKENYMRIISLRDIIVLSSEEIIEDIQKKYNDFKGIQTKPLLSLINEFILASKYRKIDILTLLLMSNEDDQQLAFILFDIFKIKDKKNVATEIYNSLHHNIRELLDLTKHKVEKDENDLINITESDIPYERRISLLKTSDDVKAKAMEKLKSMKSNFQGDSKAQSWLDGLLKIPFDVYCKDEIISFKESFIKKIKLFDSTTNLFSDTDIDNYINSIKDNELNKEIVKEWDDYKVDKKKYLSNVRTTLDEAVYGHKDAKLQLERIFAQWINGEAKGAVLGLQGPPGTGKTSLAKNGLSKCLKDNAGNPRPFVFLPIGGSVNGSTLVGHNFTYVGSTWGRIADILMSTNCMNPIIFIDEVDKISQTEHGREIISILTHLTDATQNDEFEDKFFAGIKLDLSKALIVFSFNDPNLIDPILRDRITIIETHPLSMKEKITIIKDYMLPEICKEVGFNKSEIILTEDIIEYLIETYTNEAGVRKIKEKIVEIVRDINLNRFHLQDEYNLPFTITKDYATKLFENRLKVRIKKIHEEPTVGLVNGLYATSTGLGGLTIIQAVKFPADKMLDLQLTGKAGEIMKESVQYSLKVAWSLLTSEEQNKIIEDSHNKKSFGIHIHCPDGATPKDGPSAGAAFTLAIYSLLTNKKVNNKVCMTGEIDMLGNVTAIGGLESKLNGAKKAGCNIALIPEENLEDLEILQREKLSPEDDTFKVITVSDIKQVISYTLT